MMHWKKLLFWYRQLPPSNSSWQDYFNRFTDRRIGKTPLPDVRFVVLDVESSGLNPEKDRILALSALVVQDSCIQVPDVLECFVKQPMQWAKKQVEVHGILPGSSSVRISEEELAKKLRAFIGTAVLVGHHANFDRAILNALFLRIGLPGLKNPWVDTATLAQRVWGLQEAYRHTDLDSLCRWYDIRTYDRHTASGDAFLTAQLFLKLCARLEKRGVRNLEALLKPPRIW